MWQRWTTGKMPPNCCGCECAWLAELLPLTSGLQQLPGTVTLKQRRPWARGSTPLADGSCTLRSSRRGGRWPIPTSQCDVRRFLGLTSYYRRFVKGFASVAKPLHRLTEQNAEFKWTKESQEAFEELRKCLVTAPVLVFTDFTKPFTLDTNASNSGIGAVLSQAQDDGREQVVAFASRVLSKPERRYCTTFKELLAAVVFIQQFRPYLLGRRFTLRTDHGSLTWLKTFKEPEGQLARWLEQLQQYNFDIIHRRGRSHQNADALSRLPCNQCGRSSHDDTIESQLGIHKVTEEPQIPTLLGRSTSDLREAQLKDPDIGAVLLAREDGKMPPSDTIKGLGLESRRLFQLWDQLTLKDDILWRQFEDHSRTTSPHVYNWSSPSSLEMKSYRSCTEESWEGILARKKP